MKTYKIKATDFKIERTQGATIIDSVEVSEEVIRNLLKENPELLDDKLSANTHKRKYFVPKVDDRYYWAITSNGEIVNLDNKKSDIDIANIGNCFATEQDAQDELNRRQSLVRLWNNYDDKYHWDIDWNRIYQDKHYIEYSYHTNSFATFNEPSSLVIKNTELPYFKSAEDRNQFVSENESDLLIIFNIKTK